MQDKNEMLNLCGPLTTLTTVTTFLMASWYSLTMNALTIGFFLKKYIGDSCISYLRCLESGVFGVPLLHLVQRDRGEYPKYNTPVILEEVSCLSTRLKIINFCNIVENRVKQC